MRLTEPGKAVVPPVPPPPVPNPAEPVTFDDAGPEPVPAIFMSGSEDRVMHSINHRPRRLGGPLAAIAAVSRADRRPHRHGVPLEFPAPPSEGVGHGDHGQHAPAPHEPRHDRRPRRSRRSTVSAPTASTAHAATYHVADASYSLSLAATAAECWVEATDTATGSVLFTATLFSGQSHTIAATGPVTVIAGAPAASRPPSTAPP